MTAQGPASVTAAIEIAASPSDVYALLTDLPTMASLAEEAHTMEWQKGSSAVPGAVFKGYNRNGSKTWTTSCTVTEAEPGKTFGFAVKSSIVPIAHWRYDITETTNGCRVAESTWDNRPGLLKMFAASLTGVQDRDAANAENIRLTLERLKARAEAA